MDILAVSTSLAWYIATCVAGVACIALLVAAWFMFWAIKDQWEEESETYWLQRLEAEHGLVPLAKAQAIQATVHGSPAAFHNTDNWNPTTSHGASALALPSVPVEVAKKMRSAPPGSLAAMLVGEYTRTGAGRSSVAEVPLCPPPAEIVRDEWGIPEPVAEVTGEIIDMLMRDFVDTWYGSSLTGEREFRDYLRATLGSALGALLARLSQFEDVSWTTEDVLPILRTHVEIFLKAQTAASQAHRTLFDSMPPGRVVVRARKRRFLRTRQRRKLQAQVRRERLAETLSTATEGQQQNGERSLPTDTAGIGDSSQQAAEAEDDDGYDDLASLEGSLAATQNTASASAASSTSSSADASGSASSSVVLGAAFTSMERGMAAEVAMALADDPQLRESLHPTALGAPPRGFNPAMATAGRAGRVRAGTNATAAATRASQRQAEVCKVGMPGERPGAEAIGTVLFAEQAHLRTLVPRLLAAIFPGEEMGSPLVGLLVREIVTAAVLQPAMGGASCDSLNCLLLGFIAPEDYAYLRAYAMTDHLEGADKEDLGHTSTSAHTQPRRGTSSPSSSGSVVPQSPHGQTGPASRSSPLGSGPVPPPSPARRDTDSPRRHTDPPARTAGIGSTAAAGQSHPNKPKPASAGSQRTVDASSPAPCSPRASAPRTHSSPGLSAIAPLPPPAVTNTAASTGSANRVAAESRLPAPVTIPTPSAANAKPESAEAPTSPTLARAVSLPILSPQRRPSARDLLMGPVDEALDAYVDAQSIPPPQSDSKIAGLDAAAMREHDEALLLAHTAHAQRVLLSNFAPFDAVPMLEEQGSGTAIGFVMGDLETSSMPRVVSVMFQTAHGVNPNGLQTAAIASNEMSARADGSWSAELPAMHTTSGKALPTHVSAQGFLETLFQALDGRATQILIPAPSHRQASTSSAAPSRPQVRVVPLSFLRRRPTLPKPPVPVVVALETDEDVLVVVPEDDQAVVVVSKADEAVVVQQDVTDAPPSIEDLMGGMNIMTTAPRKQKQQSLIIPGAVNQKSVTVSKKRRIVVVPAGTSAAAAARHAHPPRVPTVAVSLEAIPEGPDDTPSSSPSNRFDNSSQEILGVEQEDESLIAGETTDSRGKSRLRPSEILGQRAVSSLKKDLVADLRNHQRIATRREEAGARGGVSGMGAEADSDAAHSESDADCGMSDSVSLATMSPALGALPTRGHHASAPGIASNSAPSSRRPTIQPIRATGADAGGGDNRLSGRSNRRGRRGTGTAAGGTWGSLGIDSLAVGSSSESDGDEAAAMAGVADKTSALVDDVSRALTSVFRRRRSRKGLSAAAAAADTAVTHRTDTQRQRQFMSRRRRLGRRLRARPPPQSLLSRHVLMPPRAVTVAVIESAFVDRTGSGGVGSGAGSDDYGSADGGTVRRSQTAAAMLHHQQSAPVTTSGGVGAGLSSAGQAAVVRYVVVVEELGRAKWKLQLRYNEFFAIHQSLREQSSSFNPSFPPKSAARSMFGGGLDPAFIEERKSKLGKWLSAVMAEPTFARSAEMRVLLAPRRDTTIERLTGRSATGFGSLRTLPRHDDGYDTEGDEEGNDALLDGGTLEEALAGASAGKALAKSMARHSTSPMMRPKSSLPSNGEMAKLRHLYHSSIEEARMASASCCCSVFIAVKDWDSVSVWPFSSWLRDRAAADEGDDDEDEDDVEADGVDAAGSQEQTDRDGMAASGAGGAISPSRIRRQSTATNTPAGGASAPPQWRRIVRHGAITRRPDTVSKEQMHASLNDVFGLVADLMEVRSQGFVRRNLLTLLKGLGRTLYGGTMAKGLKSSIRDLTTVPQVTSYMVMIREAVWPEGVFPTEWPERLTDDEWDTRDAALLALLDSVPASLNSLLGKKHVSLGVIRLHAFLNCAPIMRSLVYSLLDSAIHRIVPPPTEMVDLSDLTEQQPQPDTPTPKPTGEAAAISGRAATTTPVADIQQPVAPRSAAGRAFAMLPKINIFGSKSSASALRQRQTARPPGTPALPRSTTQPVTPSSSGLQEAAKPNNAQAVKPLTGLQR